MCDVWRISFPVAGRYQVRARVEIPEPSWESSPAPAQGPTALSEWAPFVASGVFESQLVTFDVGEEMMSACTKE
jgi:hypothetical protein